MQISTKDRQTLRRLAERYSEIAHLDVQQQRMERYRKTNALEEVRPVVLIDEDATREPARWLQSVEQKGVTIWNSAPALMEMLVDYVESRGESLPASLRLVMISGDLIPVTLPERIRALRKASPATGGTVAS